MKANHCGFVEKGVRIRLYDYPDGLYANLKPCCHLNHELIPSHISQSVKIDSPKDIMQLMPLEYFREYFRTNDDLHPACLACKNYEDKGIDSPRIKLNQKTEYDNYDINKLDVVLGNDCNLACPFCSSNVSSLIHKLSSSLEKENRPESWIPLTNLTLAGSKNTSNIVAEILKHYKVHTLKLLGGEPFLKENWDKIADVIDQDYGKDLRLEVTTNGTILNDEIMSRLSKTKKAHLRISIDSVGNNYQFIRWPHSWKKMNKNIEYLKNNAHKYENISISVANLVNIFNFEFLPEIEEYFWDVRHLVSYSCEIKPATHLQNYQNLPDHIINKIKGQLKSTELCNTLKTASFNHSKESLKREFDVLLAQRKMKAVDVIGPMTREYFGLDN